MKKIIAVALLAVALVGCGKKELPAEVDSGARDVLVAVHDFEVGKLTLDDFYDKISPIADRLATYGDSDVVKKVAAIKSNTLSATLDGSEISIERISELAEELQELIN